MKITDALTTPPEAFHDFSVMADQHGDGDGPPTARYRLACRTCGGDRFALEEILSGEHGTAGVDATCSDCGEAGTVFHASRHGYDGRLGLLRFLQEITGRQMLRDDGGQPVQDAHLACEVSYSIRPEELANIAEQEGVGAQELFDGVAILARCSAADAWRYVWGYECA